MGNQVLKLKSIQGGKWKKENKKVPKISASAQNVNIMPVNSNPSQPEVVVCDVPSISTLNLPSSGIKCDLIKQETVTPKFDSCLVSDSDVSPDLLIGAELLEESSDECKHVQQTWSISELVSEFSDIEGIPIEQHDDLLASIKEEAWFTYPEFFYDFCLIASERDFPQARELKNELCTKHKLTGCMLDDDDFDTMGRDTFEAYERMIERCTKIFFYISDNFSGNNFCKRIQNGAVFQSLMSKARKEREKCVPVFPNGLCKVPLAISGISGLEIPNASMTQKRIEITYPDHIRNQRLTREKINIEKRKEYILECLNVRVKQYLEESKNLNSNSYSVYSEKDEGSHLPKCPTKNSSNSQMQSTNFSPADMFSGMQKIIENSTSAPVVTSSEVNITASSAHIGHNITLMIYPAPPQEPVSHSSSESDLSDI